MTVFWDVAPCSLVKFTDVSEVLAASIIRGSFWCWRQHELLNVSELLLDYTAQHLRRQSLYSPSWEPDMSPNKRKLYKSYTKLKSLLGQNKREYHLGPCFKTNHFKTHHVTIIIINIDTVTVSQYSRLCKPYSTLITLSDGKTKHFLLVQRV
jgi:hypothetical protein